jgi:uncharacterized protein YggE
MKKLLFILFVVFSQFVSAAPEIKGNPEEIEQYLSGIPRIIAISDQSDKVVSANKARIRLAVRTEAKALADALGQNRKIRAAIRKKLAEIGIKPDEINESKFSSTPEYGMFSDTPKSYKVNNTLSVLVDSEDKMIAVANLSDLDEHVRYLSSKPEIENKENVYKELSKKVLQNIKDKAEFYQQQLGVKLVPVYLVENAVGRPDQEQFQDKLSQRGAFTKSIGASVASYRSVALTSFGETKLSLAMTIQYKVYPPE